MYAEAVWNSLLHYESLQRYYTFVGELLAKRERLLSTAAISASSGAAIVLLAGLPTLVGQILAVAVAALVIWLRLADYSKRASQSLGFAADLGKLSTEMHALWLKLDDMDNADIEREWREIDRRATEATRYVPGNLLGYPSLQERAEDETYRFRSPAWEGAAGGS